MHSNLDWFTGGEMTAEEVAEMTIDEIRNGVLNIGITEDQDADELAAEIKELAENAS